MARILVTGDHGSVAGRDALTRLVERMRSDGHDAFVSGTQAEDVAAAVRGCDAVIGVLDRIEAGGAALMAYAHAQRKPVLGLAGGGATPHDVFAEIATIRHAADVEAWMEHLPEFYDRIRPFAGRVVRDRIPRLVKEAGHDVTFRRLTDEEKPRFLKQKIANEAQELLAADLADEKEEVGDVLEAMEAFILARGLDRDDLRRVKEGKRKRRGGFEQGFVVESTVRSAQADGDDGADPGHDPEAETKPSATTLTDEPRGPGGAPADAPSDDSIDFEYDDEEPREETAPDNIAPGRDVESRFTDL